jgi:hypothetical protein
MKRFLMLEVLDVKRTTGSMHMNDQLSDTVKIYFRFFWLCAFIAAFGCALYYSIIGYIKYVKYPIVVTVLPDEVNIGNIQFPTVSVYSTSSITETVLLLNAER